MKLIVTFNDFTEEVYENTKDAEDAILEALAGGVGVEQVHDMDNNPYSLIFTVELQKEF